MKISVVICAHNEEQWIGSTLRSLLQQARLPDEIVVVANACDDQTEPIVQQIADDSPPAPSA
jgi:glycosyltransferase involved in cell wall biosynthesis